MTTGDEIIADITMTRGHDRSDEARLRAEVERLRAALAPVVRKAIKNHPGFGGGWYLSLNDGEIASIVEALAASGVAPDDVLMSRRAIFGDDVVANAEMPWPAELPKEGDAP